MARTFSSGGTALLEEAKSEAHPADVRRMMGKKTAKVKFTQIVEEDDSLADDEGSDLDDVEALIDAYWEDEDHEDFHRGDWFIPWFSQALLSPRLEN